MPLAISINKAKINKKTQARAVLGRAQSGRRLLMSKATPQAETAEGGWSGAKEKEWPVSATPDSMVKVAPWKRPSSAPVRPHGRAWRLWAAWHFQEEDVPLPLPRLLEPAASEAAHFTACRPDKSVTCKDCSTPFVFTGREQDFFEEKGWGGAARVRCHECSKAKKAGYAERAEAGERAGEATTKRKATADQAQPLPSP